MLARARREHLPTILGYDGANGFGVALDDLAAGCSGLARLAGLDPDRVRIDRGIVWRAPESEGHADVCRAAIDHARKRGRGVLAEAIGTGAQRELMAAPGVDLFQGLLLGRPAP